MYQQTLSYMIGNVINNKEQLTKKSKEGKTVWKEKFTLVYLGSDFFIILIYIW